MTFRLLLNDPKNYTENLPKLRPKTFQNPSKIGTYSFRNAVSKTDRKNVSKNLGKARKWTPKCGPKSGTILDKTVFLFDLGGSWEPTCLPRPSQEPSGPVRASIFTDFRRIWGSIFTDFERIWTDLVIVVQSIGQLVSQSSRMQNFARVTNFRNAIANIFIFEFNQRIKKLAVAAPCTKPGSQAISNFKIPTRQIAFQSNNVCVPMATSI